MWVDEYIERECKHIVHDLYKCPDGYVICYYDIENQMVCNPIDDSQADEYIESYYSDRYEKCEGSDDPECEFE